MISLQYSFKIDEEGNVTIQNRDKFLKDMSNFPNTLFTATFKKASKERSNKQNGFYWSNFIESQIECFKEMWGETYDKSQVHDWNKANIWCDEVVKGDMVFKIPQAILPKIVICFEQSGCMANILEFKLIGYVTNEWKGEGHDPVDYYSIQPLIKGSSENRNHKDSPLNKIECWQIQHLGFNLWIHYS